MWHVNSAIIVSIFVTANALMAKSLDKHLFRQMDQGTDSNSDSVVLLDMPRIVRSLDPAPDTGSHASLPRFAVEKSYG